MENTFGGFLKQKRQEKNLTQKELANKLYVSESAVSKWEKDVAHPDITLLPKLSEILEVSEHELITASVDNKSRKEKQEAKKWRTLSFSWSLFFYISYAAALIPCFIVNLAISKTLSWFWIVVSALVLAFTFTNLPKHIKKHKLLILSLSPLAALCLLLAVCAIYTKGNWFFIAEVSVILGFAMIFVPIYIAKFKVFEKIKKYNDFVSVAVDFVILNILLIIIDCYTVSNHYCSSYWYFNLAVPIVLGIYLLISLFMSIRFLKINKLLKTSIIMFMINLIYGIAPFVLKSKRPAVQEEFDGFNIFKANFSNWSPEITLEQNVHLIVFLTILGLGLIFLIFGILKQKKKQKQIQSKKQ